MSTADALTTAEFDPAQLGVEVGQLWVEPNTDPDQTEQRTWEVLSMRVGRVTLREVYIQHVMTMAGRKPSPVGGIRMKAICPFVLAFTYKKGYAP